MTKALMRMMRRTTLPTTDTSNTVELAPSPMMGAGTEGKGRKDGGRAGGKKREREEGWMETKSKVNITVLNRVAAHERAGVHSVFVVDPLPLPPRLSLPI